MDSHTDRLCEACAHDWRGDAECPVCGHVTPDALPKLVCVYCTPHHVIRDGAEPASHGACPEGVKRFETGGVL